MVFYYPINVEEREKMLDFENIFVGWSTGASFIQKESIPIIDPATGEVKHRTIGMAVGNSGDFPITPSIIPAWFLKTGWNKLVDFTGYLFGSNSDDLKRYKMDFLIGFKGLEEVKEEGLPGRTIPIGSAPGGNLPHLKDYRSCLGGKLLYIDDGLERETYTGFWKQGKVGKYLRGLEKSLYRPDDHRDYM